MQDDYDGLYHEEWRRLPESVGTSWALRLLPTDGEAGEPAMLCVAGDCFVFVSACAPGGSRLTYEASYGRVKGDADGAVPWEILHSTQPARVGAVLLPPNAGTTADEVERFAATNGGVWVCPHSANNDSFRSHIPSADICCRRAGNWPHALGAGPRVAVGGAPHY